MEDTTLYEDDPLVTREVLAVAARPQAQANALRKRMPLVSTPTTGLEPPPTQQPVPSPAQRVGEYRGRALDLLQQAGESVPQDSDVAAVRDYAKQRGERAKADMLMGLALSAKGGESFAPTGQAMLRQALAASEPEKFGGGMIAGGQFIADPELGAQRRALRLETQARQYEGMASHAESVAQREAATQAAAETRRLIAGMTAGSHQNQQANRSFQQENALRDDFEKQVKDQRISIGTYPQIEAALSGTPSAASDMRAIFRYMKMLDPTSVVREGEYATARNASGVPSQVLNLYNRAMTGTSLTPQQRADFLAQSRSERDTALKFFNERAAEFGARAQGYGLNPRNVILGYDGGAPPPQAGALPPGVSVRRKE